MFLLSSHNVSRKIEDGCGVKYLHVKQILSLLRVQSMSLTDITHFINTLTQQPDSIVFDDFLAVIDANYRFVPSAFSNGEQVNKTGENSGSCKVFAFGLLHQLTQQQTLGLFGQHYRDVLANPSGDDHQNIRQFMQHGWDGITFEQQSLISK